MYPRMIIDRQRILANAAALLELAGSRGVEITAVIKALAGKGDLVQDIAALGFGRIGMSSLGYASSYAKLEAEKWLLRMPMPDEIEPLVRLSDGALVSELEIVRRISCEAEQQKKRYKLILMAELGDLREGCAEEELVATAAAVELLPSLELVGIGANLSCYGNILPDKDNMGQLVMLAKAVEERIKRPLALISGGNSSSLRMLEQGTLPPAINDLRLGESLLLGMLPCYDEPLPWLQQQTFVVESQIVELKQKPSVPWGSSGCCDSFGGATQHWQDKGLRKRALVALGKQDIYINGLKPMDSGVELLGGSSNYLVCDVTDSERDYGVGSVLGFACDYAATATGMTACGITKVYKDEL